MEVLSVNADQEITNFASFVGRNPRSWRGWSCLYLDLSKADEDFYHDCLVWAKTMLESYFADTEGRIYFCSNKTIHVVCKNMPHEFLEHAGHQILYYAYSEGDVELDCMICDLNDEGSLYAYHVLECTDQIFSLPTTLQTAAYNAILFPEDEYTDSSLITNMPKVLLVEDDLVTRWMVRKGLQNECDFASAQSGNKAFSVYSSFQPDVVFLDIDLPDKSGHEILNWIMHNDPGANVVMFSSNNDFSNMTRALDAGASGFIAKPFLKNELMHYIEGIRI